MCNVLETAKISKRSRNLGYGWKTGARDSASGWYIDPPSAPSATGGLRAVRNEIARRANICGHSTYFNDALFVGGRRALAYRTNERYAFRDMTLREVLDLLDAGETVEVAFDHDGDDDE